MRSDALQLEDTRLENVHGIDDYGMIHERHRIFPTVFENRGHERILDLAAGVGVVAKRIMDLYESRTRPKIICNDLSPKCLNILQEMGMETTCFDLDLQSGAYPFPSGSFDAIICLSTLEHLVYVDHCLDETRRILADNGRLYISTPNYLGLPYLLPFLWTGRTFHDPMGADSRYEFFAHIRYFTYRTLCEFICSHGFELDTVYIGLPVGSSKYRRLRARSRVAASACSSIMKTLYHVASPRWASEPVLCCRKTDTPARFSRPRKVVL